MELFDGVVRLRPPSLDDAAEVAVAVQSSLAQLQPWMPWAVDGYDRDSARDWIGGATGDREHGFVIVDDDEIIGSCGLNRFDDLFDQANLGYWIRTDRAGRGHATRAARLLTRFAFEEVGLHRVEIVLSVHNEASRRVAEKVPAIHEGILRGKLALPSGHHDAHLYSVLATDPRPSRPDD